MPIIEVKNLSKFFKVYNKEESILKSMFLKTYTNKAAVSNISFKIGKGEIVGYIGANGAGKSTTIKMLCGILTPTSGSILVNGINPSDNRKENSRNIGVVFGQRTQLWWDIPVIDSIRLMQYIYAIDSKKFKIKLDVFRELLELDEFSFKPVRQLSLGQRMRADLCCALLHSPQILFLDEPTIGLDILVKNKILEFIKHINQNYKTTIILTTHDLNDIEFLCNRAIIIDKGKIYFDGSIESLKKKYGKLGKISVVIDENVEEYKIKNFLFKINEKLESVVVEGNKVEIVYDENKIKKLDILKCFFEKCKVINFTIDNNDLKNIILNIYKDIKK